MPEDVWDFSNDLRIDLCGFDKSLRGIKAAIFIVLDDDKRETEVFRKRYSLIFRQKTVGRIAAR